MEWVKLLSKLDQNVCLPSVTSSTGVTLDVTVASVADPTLFLLLADDPREDFSIESL